MSVRKLLLCEKRSNTTSRDRICSREGLLYTLLVRENTWSLLRVNRENLRHMLEWRSTSS